jgi:hypothetical protein
VLRVPRIHRFNGGLQASDCMHEAKTNVFFETFYDAATEHPSSPSSLSF